MSGKDILEIARYMKSFANPLRLKIIDVLKEEEKTVSQIVGEVRARQCHVSQQLMFLTEKNILQRRNQSRFVFYSIKDKCVPNMLELVRIGMLER